MSQEAVVHNYVGQDKRVRLPKLSVKQQQPMTNMLSFSVMLVTDYWIIYLTTSPV